MSESNVGPGPDGGWGTPADPGAQGYGQPPAGGGGLPVGTGLLGKRRNPFASWLGLPIITLGIYSFVWIYKSNKELSRYDQRIVVNPALSVLAFIPGAILCYIPPLVAIWRLGVRVQQAQRAAGVAELNPVINFALWWVGFGALYLQFEINKIWDRYPGAVEEQPVPLFF